MKEIHFNKYQSRQADYHWQQISKNIFRFNSFVSARYHQVVATISTTPNQTILDIGCGDGVLLWQIYQKTSAQLTGLDTDADSLKIATSKLSGLKPKVKLVKGSAYKLPFTKNSFDVVVATEVIEHLKNSNLFFTEIYRVLKPKGQVIITTPVKLSAVPEDPMHVREFFPSQIQKAVSRHFVKAKLTLSHPLLLKKIYLFRLFSLNHFHFEPFRWLINIWVLLTGTNPFLFSFGRSTNQIVVGYKP